MINEIFRANNICSVNNKGYGLQELSLSLYEGEILGIYGDRYAGRGSLFSIISGETQPEKGRIFRDAFPVVQLGVKPLFLGKLSIWENIAEIWGKDHTFQVVNNERVRQMIRVLFDDFGIAQDMNQSASELSPVKRLMLEILASLRGRTKIFLIDFVGIDATAKELEMLRSFLKRLTGEKISFILFSHLYSNVLYFSDRIAILYQGRILKVIQKGSEEQLAMAGNLPMPYQNIKRQERKTGGRGNCLLSVKNLSIGTKRPASFEIDRGEYVAVLCQSANAWHLLQKGLSGDKNTEIIFEGKQENKIDERKGVYFLDSAYLDSLIEEMTPLENLCMGVLSKKSNGIVRRDYMRLLEREFYGWYGHEGLLCQNNCHNLYRKHRVAINLFRLRFLNPRLIFCCDLNIHNDIVTYRMIEDALGELSENGCAVCIVTADMAYNEEFVHRYFVIADENTRHEGKDICWNV